MTDDQLWKQLVAAISALGPDPMRCVVVSSAEEAQKVIDDMKVKGLYLAASSNAGLQEGKRRLTFLPRTAFTDSGEEERSLKTAVAALET